MFDILFGWRKASKCKNLVKKVQCRLKLMKTKRCWIVKQLRQDVAELLKNGHHQSAFERVEQLFKDENTAQVYDLLGNFCEFIIINLPYIRKHKDCPNDINEAVSTLVFSSARIGDLPELLSVRKLFGERYGQSFIMIALELLPGNLVNNQIKENLYIKEVPDDVKYRLLDEIASSCVEPEQLFLEYKPELLQDQTTNRSIHQISSSEVQRHSDNEASELQVCNATETEGKIVYIDLSSESKNFSKDPLSGLRKDQNFPNEIQLSALGEEEKLVKLAEGNETDSSSSLETSARRLPEEMIYLDDIEEFVSPVNKDGHFQDQRLFMFKSFEIPLKERNDHIKGTTFEEQKLLHNEYSVSRSSRMPGSRKRVRRRSISQENRNITDVECAVYYGVSHENLPDVEHTYGEGGNNEQTCFVRDKNSMNLMKCRYDNLGFVCQCNSNGNIVKKCSLEHPCYFYSQDKTDMFAGLSWTPNTKSSKIKDFTTYKLEERKIQSELQLCNQDSCKGEADEKTRDESQTPYLRAMTMPTERPSDSPTDNIFRSKSFPLEMHGNGYSSCRHIHPKLPDYDELAAKFMALKKENLQNKRQPNNQ